MEPGPTTSTMQTPEDASINYEYISPIGELLPSLFNGPSVRQPNPQTLPSTPRALASVRSWLMMQPLFTVPATGLILLATSACHVD